MKKTRICYTIISIVLLFTFALNLSGCASNIPTGNETGEATVLHDLNTDKAINSTPIVIRTHRDLVEGFTPNKVQALNDLTANNSNVTDFAVRLFKECEEDGKNILISPLSVLYALSMTANGAEKETLAEMESVLGMTVEELNLYLYSYMNSLPQKEKYKLNLANSVWFKDDKRFTVNEAFLQTVADYYGAGVYKAPFDSRTCDDINAWVKEKTEEMIPEILDEIPQNAIMYLVNALAFEAEWETMYDKHEVRDGIFTKEDGATRDVSFMYSREGTFLEDEKAIGFMKYYKDRKYAFVALLPNKGVSVSEYVEYLNGEKISALLANPQKTTVGVSIPKFETEFDVEMNSVLHEMGIVEAFHRDNADFGSIGDFVYENGDKGNIYIDKVVHKTFIQMGEKGTKAGAATSVGMSVTDSVPPAPQKTVHLDRPFVYMLIDCENNIPFFIGTMMDVEK